MAKYILKVSCDIAGGDWEEEIDWFTDEIYKKYEHCYLSDADNREILEEALQMAGFEFWVRKVE